MFFSARKLHLGLRTVKTGIAVALALTAAGLLDSAMPIFSAIGAISAMSRTLGDAIRACLTQLSGITIGCLMGLLLILLLPAPPPAVIGAGIIVVILLCLRLHVEFAVPLSCIVFVSVCLYDAGDPFWYAAHRFLDTAVGLMIALAVNMLIKPYNNRAQIANRITHFSCAFPDYLSERVLHCRYPSLEKLSRNLDRLAEEIDVFERQTFPHKQARQREAAYLRGCQQLAMRMLEEMTALCSMDEPGRPDTRCLERLTALGLSIPPALTPAAEPLTVNDIVLRYHLENLLNAYDFLQEMNQSH